MTWFLKQDTLQAILAGQYDPKKPQRAGDPPNRPPVVSSRVWRDDACQNMTEEQYAAWRKKQHANAQAAKTPAKGIA
jgi:hypothetical protein